MKRTASIDILFCALCRATCHGADSPQESLAVSLTSPGKSFAYGSAIPVSVTISNLSTNRIEFLGRMLSDAFPFRFNFWDENGKLLNPVPNTWKQRRLGPAEDLSRRKVELAPREEKRFRFELTKFTGSSGALENIPAGKLKIDTTLVGLIKNSKDEYDAEHPWVLHSNPINVEVTK